MRRPLMTGKTDSDHPPIETRGADAAGIERVPLMPAIAKPAVVSPRRPVAFRTPDTRTGRVLAGSLLNIDWGAFDYDRHFP